MVPRQNYALLWRGKIHYPPVKPRNLIICGHSDYNVTNSMALEYPARSWWGTNSQTPRVRGLPLGISNYVDEGSGLVFGNVDTMIQVASQPRTIKNLVYANFSVYTYPLSRAPLMELAKSRSWITIGQVEPTTDGRRKFLEDVRNHSFVLCPRGNGVDTHRLWETLYMGSIPIVERSIVHSGWQDLPILFVDSWDEITEERLLQEKIRIESSTWNMDKLRISYWINQIKQSSQPTALSWLKKHINS